MDYSAATFWYLIWRDLWPAAVLIGVFVLGFALGAVEHIGTALMRRVRSSRRPSASSPRGGYQPRAGGDATNPPRGGSALGEPIGRWTGVTGDGDDIVLSGEIYPAAVQRVLEPGGPRPPTPSPSGRTR